MPTVRLSMRFTLSMALMIFVVAALWLTVVPDTLRLATYLSVAALLTAVTATTLEAARGSLSVPLYDTIAASKARSARHAQRTLPATRVV